MHSGTNLPRVGGFNRTVILDVIRRSADGISRVEIAEQTGLSAQTVSNIVRRLVSEELVTESGRAASTGGKPRTLLRTNPTAYFSVGIHLDPEAITLVATDLDGRVISRVSRPTPRVHSPARVVRSITTSVRGLLERAQVPDGRLLGLGLATPGPIDQQRGMVVAPPNLPGWHEVPLVNRLHDEFDVPVVVDNDATAAAIGERWAGGTARTGSFAFLYFGTGIGGGLVLADQVWRGSSGNAAEFGHITVDPDGNDCSCGQRGCLEATAAPKAIVANALTALRRRRTDPLLATLTAEVGTTAAAIESGAELFRAYEQLCQAAADGHPVATAVLTTSAKQVAMAAVGLINVVDVDRIVLGGKGLRHLGAIYRDAIDQAVNSRAIARTVRTVTVQPALLGEDAGAVGAASLILDGAYSPQLKTLFTP